MNYYLLLIFLQRFGQKPFLVYTKNCIYGSELTGIEFWIIKVFYAAIVKINRFTSSTELHIHAVFHHPHCTKALY